MNVKRIILICAFLAGCIVFAAGTDDELTGTFESCEGTELGQDFSNMWNCGKLEVINAKFASYSKCL